MEDDKVLIEGTLSGDVECFGVLYTRYSGKIAWMIFKITRDEDMVHDLSQDTFMRAFIGLRNFDYRSSFYTWLTRIAINVSLNYVHCRDKGKYLILDEGIRDLITEDVFANGRSYDPELRYVRGEKNKHIQDAINLLPEDLGRTFLMRLEGMSQEEIAGKLGINVGTVKSRIFNAKQEMKRILSREVENG